MKRTFGKKNEQGFVLVTALVLLAVLTVLGVVSAYKTVVEVKISKLSGDSAKALMAANAGLAAVYEYWANDQTEFEKALADAKAGRNSSSATSTLFELTHSPTSLGDTTYLPTDSQVQSASKNIRVYELTSSSFTLLTDKSTWGASNNPQVAVWATGFASPTNDYPYESPSRSGTCSSCRLVVYALARVGETRRMVRQVMSSESYNLDGVSALTNAPNYRSWQDMCDGVRNGNGQKYYGTGYDKPNTADVAWTCQSCTGDALIEATQAEYVTGYTPSGIAMASNTHTGGGGKNFRKDISSTTVATFDSIPLIAYAGHGSAAADNAVQVDYADTTVDGTAPPNAPNLPSNKLPRKLLSDATYDTDDEMTYFQGDPNTHLFNLDVYRWAAEQFTCQTIGSGSTAVTTASTGSGKYCLKADALRAALGTAAPVTGRLTMAEFEYNLANSIPMFGMVRVMYPVKQTSTTALDNCAALGGVDVFPYDTYGATAAMVNSGTYDGNATTLDGDGNLGANAKLIVYGSIFFDFFVDDGGGAAAKAENGTFEPESGERLVNAFEAVDARMELELPAYVNPALPKFTSTATALTFPTGASGGSINTNTGSTKPSGVAINLASPTGWFPASEGRIPSTSDNSVGSMELVNSLVTMALEILPNSKTGGSGLAFDSSSGPGLWTNTDYKARYQYYYDLMYKTAKTSDSNSWPISPSSAPANLTVDVCIGSEDCTAGNNDGDKMHLLFPSGYHHGWKVALAALNITADEWNSMFSNLSTLAANHKKTTASSYNYGSSQRPRGSPFNATLDTGFDSTNLTEIADGQNDYFFVTEDSSGYGLLDGDWRDIPAMIYAGGLVDTHEYNNVSGIIYTPGPLEWETGKITGGTGYVNGAIITGFGSFNENNQTAKQIFVYDNQSTDNINTNKSEIVVRRYAWQELR